MNNSFDLGTIDTKDIIKNKKLFNELVYTPITEAKLELNVRWNDKILEGEILEFFKNDIPQAFVSGFKATLFRQVMTPNYEFKHFIEITKINKIEQLLLEYESDNFSTNNTIKRALGKIPFRKIVGEKKTPRYEYHTIIDFNINAGKELKDVKTTWGEPLINVHHRLLESLDPKLLKCIFDGSEWFHRCGGGAKNYYEKYIALFVRNGILFENFVLRGHELSFIETVFLPSFISVWKSTGKKPLIVQLLPENDVDNIFWDSHSVETLDCLDIKK